MEKFRKLYAKCINNLYGVLKSGVCDNKSGVYLLSLRVLNKDSNVVIYNYIYYPEEFVFSLLIYIRHYFDSEKRMSFCESENNITIVESNLGPLLEVNDISGYICDDMSQQAQDTWSDTEDLNIWDTVKFVKSQKYNSEVCSIVDLIRCGVARNYFEFLKMLLGSCVLEDDASDLYLLKNCLFVVKDINVIISELKECGININKGPASQRDTLNYMSGMLYTWDLGFRDHLHRVVRHNVETGIIPGKVVLSKSKFSFSNIHMRLVNVRYYSTSGVLRTRPPITQ